MSSSLYLYPENWQYEIAPDTDYIEVLKKLNIIDTTLDNNRYLLSDGFFQQIIFAGCSPHIKLHPAHDSDLDFCHLSINAPSKQVKLMVSQTHSRPRCSGCGQPVANWKNLQDDWQQNPLTSISCQRCQKNQAALELNWKQYAVIARQSLQFHHIYPGEAVPSDRLLNDLVRATSKKWLFGWADSFN